MPKPVNDQRADSTLDAITNPANLGTPRDTIGAIAEEEIAENEAVREAAEQAEQHAAEAAMAELVTGWQEACRHGADIITSTFDGLKPVWTQERMDNLGAALARADAHYGWGGAGKLLGHPLVGVGVAALPVAIGTAQFVKLERAKLEAAQRAAKIGHDVPTMPAAPGAAPPAPSKDPAKPGGPVPNIGNGIDRALAADTYMQ